MAKKGNIALAVDREAIAEYLTYATALDNELDERRKDINSAIAYLTSEENLGGGDTEDFKRVVETINGIMTNVKKKISTIVVSVSGVANALGAQAGRKKTTLKEARENMGKVIMDMKQKGK